MTRLYIRKKIIHDVDKFKWILFFFGLTYAVYWLLVSPIQYNGDSDSYLSVGRMLLGHVGPIFRTPGYPILLILTGAIIPGTFIPLLFVQAVLAAMIPVIIYQILTPYGQRLAIITAVIAVLTGTTTAHISQVMTEPLFTIMLFIGLAIAIRIMRDADLSPTSFYWLAFTFAALNSIRPFAWLIFWPLLLMMTCFLWRAKRLSYLRQRIAGAALLFMALMSLWTIADDLLFSFGARYSPVLSLKSPTDNFFEIYLDDMPFYEAYFNPWKQRVENITEDPNLFGTLKNQPAMATIRNIVLQQITKNVTAHQPGYPRDLSTLYPRGLASGSNESKGSEQLTKNKNIFLQDNSIYPYQLFGKYANNPQILADRMFAAPNYAYANYIRSVIEQNTPKETRLELYYAAAKETGFNWPNRWLNLWKMSPLFFLTGPSHGNSSQQFLLAYTSLRHYVSNPAANNYQSLVNEHNGPATRFLFTTLTEGLRDHPELWRNGDNLFSPFIDNPEAMTNFMISQPNQQYAWDITRMLWDLMGYHTMSELLQQVTNETIASYRTSWILRVWDNIIMTVAGPGYIEFDSLGPQFGQVEIYDYLETPQLSAREKKELQSTKNRYLDDYAKWQEPIKLGYFLFYLLKPFFFVTSMMALAVLWSRKQPMATPLILILPYSISIIVYGTLFTALPRYTDPTLLLPFIVTIMALPECLRIWHERIELDLKHTVLNQKKCFSYLKREF